MAGWLAGLRRRPRTAAASAAVGVAIGLSWGGSASRTPSWRPTEGREPIRVVNNVHTYTFTQAVRAGVMPSLKEQLQESGLPLCGTKPPTSGKARQAYEQAAQRNDGDTCMADPRGTITSTGGIQQFYAMHPVSVGSSLLRYTDSAGWSIEYPRRFHAAAYLTNPGFSVSSEGASFANFTPVPAPEDSHSDELPATGILFELTTSFGGPIGPRTLGHEARFPLSLAHSVGRTGADSLEFQADGTVYRASFQAGAEASPSDLKTLAAVIESIRFPELRKWTRAGSYVTLDPSGAYPVGSVTLIDAPRSLKGVTPFYLIHDRSGFRVLAWPGNLYGPPWTGPCREVQHDLLHDQFSCRSGGRWDSEGRVIVNPPGACQLEPLFVEPTAVAWDGHVLVTAGSGRLAWPAKSPLADGAPASGVRSPCGS